MLFRSRSDTVELQCGEQADDALRDRGRRDRQSVILGDGLFRQAIHPAGDSLEQTLGDQAGQHLAVDSFRCKVARGDALSAAGKFEHLVTGGGHVANTGHLFITVKLLPLSLHRAYVVPAGRDPDIHSGINLSTTTNVRPRSDRGGGE